MDLVIGVTNEARRADTYGNMTCDSAQGTGATNMARWYALTGVDITFLVQRTVIICSAFLFNALAAANERIADSAWGTDAVVASWQVYALSSRGTWVMDCDALVDINTNSIGLELIASWAHTETLLWAHIDAVFILRAWVGSRAVPTCDNTVLPNTIIVWRAPTSAGR